VELGRFDAGIARPKHWVVYRGSAGSELPLPRAGDRRASAQLHPAALGFDTRLSDVAPDEHKRFKHVLGEGDIDLRTCNRVLTTLRQLFVFGEEKGYCGAHSMPKNFREDPQTMVERWRILSPEQIGTLLAHAGDDLQPLLAFVANTGLRIGTALQTERVWIDWRGRLVN
jgi:integrase